MFGLNMKNNFIYMLIGFVLCAAILHFCEGKKPEDKVLTKIKIIKVVDTLKVKGPITTKFKKVYIHKTDSSIVYVDRQDSTSIEARKYSQEVSGKRMKGVVHVTTTGELLDLCAEIETKDSIIETTITKYRNKSKAFASFSYNTNNQLNLGIDWNIKNKILLKGGVGYETQTLKPYISVGIGVPLF